MKEQSTIYADIRKVEKDPANSAFRLVHARISDETKDLDGQTADYDWLKTALPEWFKWGNVRDMHENNVVGKGKVLTDVPAERAYDGILKVVDPVAVMKVDEGLFTGVSIGIKGPRVINQKGATVHPSQPGRIIAGKIVEISLVDHPCNENCKITVAKMAGKKLGLIKGTQLEIIERGADDAVTEEELDLYKKRFDPILAKAGVALADGSYLIMTPEDLMLAKALQLTGFGNVTAADRLIKRRESEFTSKAAPATKQPTADQAEHPVAPGARENRDNPDKNAPPSAKNPDSKNPDKESPAHQSPDASGSSAAYDDQDPSVHPPTKAKKKKGKNNSTAEVDPHTHGDNTGSVGTQTDTSKKAKVKQKVKSKTVWKYATGDPAEWSDKKLTKAIAAFQITAPALYKTATSSYTGDGRPLLEQIARDMQGRIYSATEYAQGGRTQDNRIDKPQDTGNDDLLNSGDLMRDGDSRINAHTPAQALGQSGPMSGGNAIVTSGGDAGVPNTAHPFDTAPQAGSNPARVSPGGLPGSLRAPGDAQYASKEVGAPGQAGEGSAAPSMKHPTGVAQAGPDPNVGTRSVGSANTAFAFPSKKAAKADRKKSKAQKKLNKLAKAATADRLEAAVPDSTKAVIAGILKKFSKDLEKNVLSKYATADQLSAVQADIEKLGEMAKPGGPFVGAITAVEKVVNANEFAQPENQVVDPDILEQMERYERMTKSDNRQLATSAQVGLKKLLETHFPAEVSAELTKRRRSAAK